MKIRRILRSSVISSTSTKVDEPGAASSGREWQTRGVICKAPNCEVCVDVAYCFGPETGEPLSVLQTAVLDIRQSRRED